MGFLGRVENPTGVDSSVNVKHFILSFHLRFWTFGFMVKSSISKFSELFNVCRSEVRLEEAKIRVDDAISKKDKS